MERRAQVRARFEAVNGVHAMTEADDAYVEAHFVPLGQVARARAETPEDLRGHMLGRRLPLPSYLRSDGTEMVPRDLLALADLAGGVNVLREWFQSHWHDREAAEQEWGAYLDGHYVCLRVVSPENIRRKSELVESIEALLAAPEAARVGWRTELHALVDELDELEPPFAPYDRLRFGGPVSRDRLIDDVRRAFPRLPVPV